MLATLLLGGCFLRADALFPPNRPPAEAGPHDKSRPKETKPLDETESLRSASAAARIEALRAWAASTRGPLPQAVVDLRSDDDPRVRAAALATLAARKHPEALDCLSAALHNVNLDVRLAAIRGLGELDNEKSRAMLAELFKDRAELIRAEAVATAAAHGAKAAVLSAAGDSSWRVRMKVAEALAGYCDADGDGAARRMLSDPGAEVQRQAVRSVAAWPAVSAVPVLLDALDRDAMSVRKLAAKQLALRWHSDVRFPYEAPPARREEALAELRARYQRESISP